MTNKHGQNGEALAIAGEHEDVSRRLKWHNKLHEMFEKEGLVKYLPLFEAHQISQRRFMELNTQKLVSMGITLLGPQKKIESLVSELRRITNNGNPRLDNSESLLLTSN